MVTSLLILAVLLFGENVQGVKAATTVTFAGQELLGRPTNTSITIDVIPNSTINLYYQYGTSTGNYTAQTSTVSAPANQPCNVVISGLSANTKYFYRMQYQVPPDTGWVARSEHSFWTQRSSGSTYTFDITSDSHVNVGGLGNGTTWTQTLNNVLADHPDFELDLGDTFGMDGVTTVANANSVYAAQRKTYFDLIGNTMPVYIVVGNHEQQEGWHFSDTTDITLSPPVMGINAEKTYFLNPEPDGSFYTGNSDTSISAISGNHLRDDYYAWTWGDALFVVIDPFGYTLTKPFSGNLGGGESGTTSSNDRWTWTLGQTQFNWLKQTLAASTAEYKFIFMHQEVGGNDSQLYGRGGAGVNIGEWGGYNEDGTTWGFDTKRSGWGGVPIQGLLETYGVTAVFHGHDHEYAYEVRNGVVYQELPAAGFSGYGFQYYSASNQYTDEVLPSPGNLRVTVTPSQVTVAYVDSSSASVKYTYTISPKNVNYTLSLGTNGHGSVALSPSGGTYTAGTTVTLVPTASSGYQFGSWTGTDAGSIINTSGVYTLVMNGNKTVSAIFAPNSLLGDVNGDGQVNSTDALIVLSGDIGLSTTAYCPMVCGDVNGDGLVNSTDALIILSYDIGKSVPYQLGKTGCPKSVTPCAGCSQ